MDMIYPDKEQFELMCKLARKYADDHAPMPSIGWGYAEEVVIWHKYHRSEEHTSELQSR